MTNLDMRKDKSVDSYKRDVQYAIGEVLDKVRGLTDLLFGLSTGIERGVDPCEESLALLATITQGIEADLESVLKAE